MGGLATLLHIYRWNTGLPVSAMPYDDALGDQLERQANVTPTAAVRTCGAAAIRQSSSEVATLNHLPELPQRLPGQKRSAQLPARTGI